MQHTLPFTAYVLTFQFLSSAFLQPPTRDFLQHAVDEALFVDFPLDSPQPDVQQGLAILQAFCQQWQADQFQAVYEDYNRLLVGPDHLDAPPWESVYRNEEHTQFDEHTLAVRHAYQTFGMNTPLNEPDDHIGYELSFMALLAEKALTEAVPHAILAMRQFLTDHLLGWAPTYLHDVIHHAQTDYYRGLAWLTLGCLADARQFLENV